MQVLQALGVNFMKLLSAIFLVIFVGAYASAEEELNCEYLVGTWVGSSFEYSIQSQKTFQSTFNKDGTFEMVFNFADGVVDESQKESGVWECDGRYVVEHTLIVSETEVEYVDLYEYLELTASYSKYRAVLANCDDVIGDCNGKLYESVKIR